mmetsp:Transcript_1818/g.4004  ORF Transcript_1818/g.4004 Transcript_1818/m.4004 type:complete len:117 (-) Transcript_1818:54-404(-)
MCLAFASVPSSLLLWFDSSSSTLAGLTFSPSDSLASSTSLDFVCACSSESARRAIVDVPDRHVEVDGDGGPTWRNNVGLQENASAGARMRANNKIDDITLHRAVMGLCMTTVQTKR